MTIPKLEWKILWESLKEPLRLIALTIVSFLITQLVAVQNPEPWIVGMVLVLRFVDKWLYNSEKDRDGVEWHGLTGF